MGHAVYSGSSVMDVRAAVIGYGLAGSVFHAPLIAATPGMRVCGIVTGSSERQAAARQAYPDAAVLPSAEEVWKRADDFDLVVVASPNRSHIPLALASIEAGLPAVVDKPLAASVADARAAIEASRQAGVPLTVFQNRRWDGDFLTVRSLLDSGSLGRPLRFESRFERYRPLPRAGAWRERPEPEEAGGLLFDLGSHLIDQACVLFGDPADVFAEVDVRRPGAQVDDDTFVALRFESGVRAHLWMNVTARILGPRFHVTGLHGSYVKYGLDPQESALREGRRPGVSGWAAEPQELWGTLSTDLDGLHFDGAVETMPGRYDQFYSLVAGALRGENEWPVAAMEAVRTLEIIEAARTSARSRRVVELQ
jgi:predicted dehydrogenase